MTRYPLHVTDACPVHPMSCPHHLILIHLQHCLPPLKMVNYHKPLYQES